MTYYYSFRYISPVADLHIVIEKEGWRRAVRMKAPAIIERQVSSSELSSLFAKDGGSDLADKGMFSYTRAYACS